MAIDHVVPQNRDCIKHTITSTGDAPRRHYTVTFDYEDGSQRTFDGREWRLTCASHAVAAERHGNLFSTVTGLPVGV